MERLREIFETYRRECLIGLVAAVIVGGLFFWNGRSQTPPVTPASTQQRQQPRRVNKQSGKVYVDVKGAVIKPGVYCLSHGARLAEAVNAAGGFRDVADQNQVNLAKQVCDQQMIYIPMKGEQTEQSVGQPGSESSVSDKVVNLNTATKEQLTTITGIGDKKADLILAYRQQHGQFQKVDDLKNITGFGDKTVAKIKDQLAV